VSSAIASTSASWSASASARAGGSSPPRGASRARSPSSSPCHLCPSTPRCRANPPSGFRPRAPPPPGRHDGRRGAHWRVAHRREHGGAAQARVLETGAAALVKPLMIVMSRRDWRGMENNPGHRAGDHRGQPRQPRRSVRSRATTSSTSGRLACLPGQGRACSRLPVLGPLAARGGPYRPSSAAPIDAARALDAANRPRLRGRPVCPFNLSGGQHHKQPGAVAQCGARPARRDSGWPRRRRWCRVAMWGPAAPVRTRGTHKLRPVPQTP
jgi:hypothetical protein